MLKIPKWIPTIVCLLLVACGTSYVDPIPTQLATIEGEAEGVVDSALKNDLVAGRQHAMTVASSWAAFRPSAVTAGASAVLLMQVDAAIGNLTIVASNAAASSIEFARAGNAVSAPMEDMCSLYNPQIPPTLLTLDYLGREIQLDARVADYVHAESSLRRAEQIWSVLTPSVVAKGGAADAQQLDVIFATLRMATTAKNAAQLEAAALMELESVDSIETIFANAIDKGD
jgi:hypothetical protein